MQHLHLSRSYVCIFRHSLDYRTVVMIKGGLNSLRDEQICDISKIYSHFDESDDGLEFTCSVSVCVIAIL